MRELFENLSKEELITELLAATLELDALANVKDHYRSEVERLREAIKYLLAYIEHPSAEWENK